MISVLTYLRNPEGYGSLLRNSVMLFFPVLVKKLESSSRVGQKPGSLARQNGESMLSYVSTRRRWWKLFKTLDGSIELSEPMRAELLLELDLLATAQKVRVRLIRLTPPMPGTRRMSTTRRIWTRRRISMKPPTKGDGEEYEDYELCESEAIALNCLEELEESSEAGHAVQLQLAAHAAFGKAKGKGKGKSKKGKGKGKGKAVRSHLTLEQRREKLKSLKAKSKCMRCGALGHWAGDPECKFPTSQGGGKGKAHLAVIADEGLSIIAKNDSAAAFVARAKSSAAPSAAAPKPIAAPVHEPREMVMEGGDKKFYLGQHRNETYSEVAKKIEFIQWLMAQSDLSMQNQDFLTWFNMYYTIQDGSVQARASLGLPEGAYVPKTGIRKTPPNPPFAQKCGLCKDFTNARSTMNYIRSTCRDCGHVEQKPREVTYTHDPTTCRHEVVDRRISSRSISRTFCKQRGTFIDEVLGEFHAQRRAAASKVLDATSNALDVINAMTNKEAVTDYSPEAVEAILGAFTDRVLQAIQDEDRVDDIVLHDHQGSHCQNHGGS